MVGTAPWKQKVIGSAAHMIADPDEIRRALDLFADPEGQCQVVALPSAISRSHASKDLAALTDSIGALPGGLGIYFEINPVREGLSSKAKSADITRRRWLFFDIDPVKAEGCEKLSATDAEKEAALEVAGTINLELLDRGWPAPVVVDSGNGWYLLYRIDLPNDEESRKLVRGVLYAIDGLIEGANCSFDTSVHNADRLAKLPGTWARKGIPSDDRPHRPCRIISIPTNLEILPPEKMRELIPAPGEKPAPTKRDPFKLRIGQGSGERSYCLAALEGERTRLALTRSGDRDNQLYRSGAALGELIAPGRLEESEVRESLLSAARECGLLEDIGDQQVLDKLNRSMAKGRSNPRTIPERNGHEPEATKWTVPVEPGKAKGGPTIYTVPELMGLELPAPRWAIPGLLSEGLTILAGKPKLGKSWMALNLALTIAAGGMALGSIRVQAGDVLYLALEDRLRRIRDRSAKVLKGLSIAAPARLSVAVEWKRQDKGGVQDLANWLGQASDPRLVVIDVWAKFRSPAKSKGSAYEQDYEQLTEVKSMADHYGASVLALHHTRKSAAEDVFDEISGTLGIAGAADGSMVLARARGKNEGTLAMTGRDIEEQTLAVEFVPETFTWKSHGNAEQRYTGELQKKIVDYLRREGAARFVKDIAAHLEKYEASEIESVRKVVARLCDMKVLRREGNAFSFPGDNGDTDPQHWTDR